MSSSPPSAEATAPPDICTKATCPIEYAYIDYLPTLAGNSIYLAIFAILLVAQLFLGIRRKTWGFMVGMVGGNMLEMMGYGARIGLNINPFNFDLFLMNIVTLTIGPAFFAASIYISLGHIIQVHGGHLSRLKPRTYTIMFIFFDFISLLLQAIGGGIASSSDNDEDLDLGVNIMIAGLSYQVFSLAVYMICWAEFSWRTRRTTEDQKNPAFAGLRQSFKFRAFEISLWIATILIFLRSIYRVVELQGGYEGEIANHEASFMVLEGPLIFIAVGLLTVFHPGTVFGDFWRETDWSFRDKSGASKTER